jgi:transcriptional regulator with XRE-family HTH domain
MKERIEKILEDKKMTQAEFADLIGVNRSSITHIMTGRNKSSDTVVARTLLVFPDINPNWLSAGEGEMYLEHVYIPTKVISYNNNELEEENPLAYFNADISENKNQTNHFEQKNNPPESNIQDSFENISAISKSPEDIAAVKQKEKLPASANGKKIRKIVFFYTDKTFEEYYPED